MDKQGTWVGFYWKTIWENYISNLDVLKNVVHRSTDEIIAEIDAAFKCFDYVDIF